jgi:hypothetical protein
MIFFRRCDLIMQMQRDVSFNQDFMSDLVLQRFEGINVNLQGLRFGSKGEQRFYGVEPRSTIA